MLCVPNYKITSRKHGRRRHFPESGNARFPVRRDGKKSVEQWLLAFPRKDHADADRGLQAALAQWLVRGGFGRRAPALERVGSCKTVSRRDRRPRVGDGRRPGNHLPASSLASGGAHRWRVVAIDPAGTETPVQRFFLRGRTAASLSGPRIHRILLRRRIRHGWSLESMNLTKRRGTRVPSGGGAGHCHLEGRSPGLRPKERSATHVTPGTADSAAGVGFQSDDGTRIYAVVDLKRQQLRLERRVAGPTRYSIFDVTPKTLPGAGMGRAHGEATARSGKLPPSRSRSAGSCRANSSSPIRGGPRASWPR